MASDTFTCSRCGQVSYYRDGSYLFGQQIICARCYAAQAAPPPGMAIPAAAPAMPGAPQPQFQYAQGAPPPRANVCGMMGLLFALASLASLAAMELTSKDMFKVLMEQVKKNPQDQGALQKAVEDYRKDHPTEALVANVCSMAYMGTLLLGLILSVIGLFTAGAKKGMAIGGLLTSVFAMVACCGSLLLLASAYAK